MRGCSPLSWRAAQYCSNSPPEEGALSSSVIENGLSFVVVFFVRKLFAVGMMPGCTFFYFIVRTDSA